METGKPIDSLAPRPGESVADPRARIAQRQAEAVERRQRERAEQTSDANLPGARIRIWEQLHQISLPRSPTHKVLRVIAADTALSLEDVRAEQRLRTTVPPKSVP